jgi:lipopolysaccharide transport system permease protein
VSETEAIAVPTTTIERDTSVDAPPGSHGHLLDMSAEHSNPIALLRALWGYRYLTFTLARKDFFVRYRRATFGVLWAVAIPFIQAMVLTLVFTVIVKLPAPNPHVPRSVFMFSGIIGFTFFNISVLQASTAIVDGRNLSSRIYFPRAVLPLVAVGSNAYALIASSAVMLILAVSLGVHIDQHVLLIIPAIALDVIFTISLGLVLSALHVFFRDVRYIVQAVLLALFYVTPIFYSLSRASAHGRLTLIKPSGTARTLLLCNPLAGIVELFRASVGANDDVWLVAIGITLLWTVTFLVIGLVLQSRWDRKFVDLL